MRSKLLYLSEIQLNAIYIYNVTPFFILSKNS